jgi:hypothetical protein
MNASVAGRQALRPKLSEGGKAFEERYESFEERYE